MKHNPNFQMAALFLATTLSSVAQPVITNQPQDQLAIPGQRITMTVAAASINPPLAYQWLRESTPLTGRTGSSLVFTNVQVPDAGNYAVAVSDTSGSITSRLATLSVIGPVALDPKLSANIRLGDDPAALPTTVRAQAEPHIARSYKDPNLLVAIFQEGRLSGGAVNCGYSISTNAGMTWTRALMPGLTTNSGGPYGRASDPVAAFDLNDNIVLNTLVLPPAPSAPLAVVVSISTNKGAMFSAPKEVDQRLSLGYPDKNWIAINTFSKASHANRMFVAYTRAFDAFDIVRVFSDNGGVTWSARKSVTPSNSLTC